MPPPREGSGVNASMKLDVYEFRLCLTPIDQIDAIVWKIYFVNATDSKGNARRAAF